MAPYKKTASHEHIMVVVKPSIEIKPKFLCFVRDEWCMRR
jgi:hypothetical protein